MSANDPTSENQSTPKGESACIDDAKAEAEKQEKEWAQKVRWPESMPTEGRLPKSKEAASSGKACVVDCNKSCEQTIHVSIFFDGTNNNDDKDNKDDKKNKNWRDSNTSKHTNIARLYNAAIDDKKTMFSIYIPGVGTPFRKIGEKTYDEDGKSIARGFDPRCVWAYTRLLNAVHAAMTWGVPDPLFPPGPSEKERKLISDARARELCNEGGDPSKFATDLAWLNSAYWQAIYKEKQRPKAVKKIWINVFGFSRGAAGARAFAHKLLTEWAPGGNLLKYAPDTPKGKNGEPLGLLPYEINFMGLFDTVASVDWADSFRMALNISTFSGHSWLGRNGMAFAGDGLLKMLTRKSEMGFAADGALGIHEKVRFCYHAFSIHEQRMSFPLDSIRKGDAYPKGYRMEVAYPGVHSDVGGGYRPGEQGKACDSNGNPLDSAKLSQIPLHDMYIEALKCGVPLMTGDQMRGQSVEADFAIDAEMVRVFNAWRSTVGSISTIEDAMRIGMEQMLRWRTLRARFGTPDYITEQPFYKRAPEDPMLPVQFTKAVEGAKETGFKYHDIRPGEKPRDSCINDKTYLRQSAEEMRLLLGKLYPDKRKELQVEFSMETIPSEWPNQDTFESGYVVRASPSDSPRLRILPRYHISIAIPAYFEIFCEGYDVVPNPVDDEKEHKETGFTAFLKKYTEEEKDGKIVEKLEPSTITLFDDYIHDSRAWFRTPWFHEYAPGGYFWPRVVFVGGNKRTERGVVDPNKVSRNDVPPEDSTTALAQSPDDKKHDVSAG